MPDVQVHDLTGDMNQLAIGIRGFGSDAAQNSLVLYNGVPFNNPDLSVPNLSFLNMYQLKRIEVIQGSQGVLYGDQAVGGVVNIITKIPKKDQMLGQTSYGSYATQKHQLSLDKVFYNGISFALNLKHFFSHNYRRHNRDRNSEISGSINYDANHNFWHFDYSLSHDDSQYAGALTAAEVKADRRQAENLTSFTKNNFQFFHLKQQQHLNGHWETTTDLAHRGQNRHGFVFGKINQKLQNNYINWQLQGLIHQALLTTGLKATEGVFQLQSALGFIRDTEQQLAVYSQVNLPLNEQVEFILGARGARQFNQLTSINSLHNINSAFVTTIGVQYEPNHQIKWYIRRAGNFRFPKADENALTPINIRGLNTQTGVSYETGVILHHKKGYSKLNFYILDLNNEISFDPMQTPLQPFGANRNLDPTRRLGGSVSLAYLIISHVLLSGQYSYVDARFRSGPFKFNHIPFVAADTAKFALSYQFAVHWHWYTEAIFTGSRNKATDDANRGGKLPEFTLINSNIYFEKQHVYVSFRVNNIFNNHYNAYATFVNLTQQSFFYPAPGRNILLTVGVKLG